MAVYMTVHSPTQVQSREEHGHVTYIHAYVHPEIKGKEFQRTTRAGTEIHAHAHSRVTSDLTI